MEYLLIDGYNIINAWRDVFKPDKEPLEDCRKRLLEMLSNYQGYKNINVIVVFDAHMVKGSQHKEEVYDRLTVVYTKENFSADNYIERFVYRMGNIHRVRVATSDYLEQTMILNKGGIRMSPRELRQEIESVCRRPGKSIQIKKTNKINTLMSNLDPELAEKLDKMRKGN